jgi:hypothetical protein
LNDSSHLGWPIPVLTPVPVLVLDVKVNVNDHGPCSLT